MTNKFPERLEAFEPPTNIKLALLWASLMFLYIYNEYFSMYCLEQSMAWPRGAWVQWDMRPTPCSSVCRSCSLSRR